MAGEGDEVPVTAQVLGSIVRVCLFEPTQCPKAPNRPERRGVGVVFPRGLTIVAGLAKQSFEQRRPKA